MVSTTGTTAVDTTSMKQTTDTTDTIAVTMVTEDITAKANTPTPTLITIMMAAAETQVGMDVMTITTVGTIATQSMADIIMGTSEQEPTHMRQTTPPQRNN